MACPCAGGSNVTCYNSSMPRPRIHADDDPAARMRRSRETLRARGGRHVQIRLEPDARRVLAALELAVPTASRADLVATALADLAVQHRFPVRLSRDEEMRIASLANGPFTVRKFRETGFGDTFLAGVAMALASDLELPRVKLLTIARELAPEIVDADGYRRWLAASPIRLARLFKLVDVERSTARARSAA